MIPRVASLLLLLLPGVRAPDAAPIVVELVGGRNDRQAEVVVAHVFGGRPAALQVRLHGLRGQTVDLAATLHQVAGAIAAPLGGLLELATSVEGAETPEAPWLDLPVLLPLPSVERTTTIEVRYLVRNVAEAEAWRPAGRTRIAVSPRDLLAPLRSLARGHPLLVVDRGGRLTAILERHDVPFEELDEAPGVIAAGAGTDLTTMPATKDALAIWVRAEPRDRAPFRSRTPSVPERLFARTNRVLVLRRAAPLVAPVTVRCLGDRMRVDGAWTPGPDLADDAADQQRLLDLVQLTLAEPDLLLDD